MAEQNLLSSPVPSPSAQASGAAHWESIARRWRQVGSPLRPAAQDVANFREALAKHPGLPDSGAGRRPLRLLILGVTPELYELSAEIGADVLAVDRTRGMIEALWPGPRTRVMQADWRAMPLGAGSRDAAVCDGGLHLLDWPEGQSRVVGSLRRVIAPGGVCLVRLYCPPARQESVETVVGDLLTGRIPNLNVLKLRLGHALQPDAKSGVALREVWEMVHALDPDRQRLAARLGWPLEHLLAIDSYRDCAARYHFVTLDQARGLFCDSPGGFDLLDVVWGDYPLSEQCPTMIMRRKADSENEPI